MFSLGRRERLSWGFRATTSFSHSCQIPFGQNNEVSDDLQYTNTYYHLDLSSFSQIHRLTGKCILTLQNIKSWTLGNLTLSGTAIFKVPMK